MGYAHSAWGRGQRAEDRGQRAEDRGQRAEDRGQRAEDRGQAFHGVNIGHREKAKGAKLKAHRRCWRRDGSRELAVQFFLESCGRCKTNCLFRRDLELPSRSWISAPAGLPLLDPEAPKARPPHALSS